MKSLVVLIAVLLPLPLIGQPVHFPLDVGNQWLYDTGRRLEIVGDTALPNGKTYSITTDTDHPTTRILIRQEGDSVYYLWSPGDADEYVQFDLNRPGRDTLLTHWGHFENRRTSSPLTIFGIERPTRSFAECDTPYCWYYWDYQLADSIGIASMSEGINGGAPPFIFTLDGAVIAGKGYGTLTTTPPDAVRLPSHYTLSQNYPNPFNPSTAIRYELPVASTVTLDVYDLLGRTVVRLVNGRIGAGVHSAEFDARNLPSGVYIYRLQADRFSASRAMVVLR